MSNSATLQQLQQQPAKREQMPVAMSFFNLEGFELMQRIAKAFSSSDLVPKQYQNNLPNCMIALDMAQRIGANPLMCMQNLYVVHGTPGWSAKFLIATVNTCGRYSSLRYEWKGKPGEPGYGCRAWAIEKETNERLDGIWVTWDMVNAEGWASKNGSKWKTMADQMFVYRSASFWQRAYAPDLGMGLQTAEELEDAIDAKRGSDGSYSVDVESLRSVERTVETEASKDDAIEHQQAEHVDQMTGEIRQAEPEPAEQPKPKPEQKPQPQQADDLDLNME